MNQKGFINAVILIILALIILGYFNIDIAQILDVPTVKGNLLYVWSIAVSGFNYAVELTSSLIEKSF